MANFKNLSLVLVCVVTLAAFGFAKSTITIVNGNDPGVGFNDPTPATPVDGNPGVTLGEQRLNAFKEAARIWSGKLDSPVEIRIYALFTPLTCTSTSAVLGSAGTTYIFSDFAGDTVGFFPGPEFTGTWYHSALADKRAGQDLVPDDVDIVAYFNSAIGNTGCLDGQSWYLGFDNAQTSTQINLVTVLIHEFAHGLGFSQFASVSTGAEINGLTDIYAHYIFDNSAKKTWDQMTDVERVTSAINARKVVWNGETVTKAVPRVLARGVPSLTVSSPAAIAGSYEVGEASFGAALTSTGVNGKVVFGLDAADASGPSTIDACTALTNADDVKGNIALVQRGTCAFVVKAKNAQDAGAIAVLVVDNTTATPPVGLSGTDATITIPVVRIGLADGNRIAAQLSAGVKVTLGVDMSRIAGADSANHALLYTPNPVAPGSTISHWDTIAKPNQLMEPAINSDLTHEVAPPYDLTLPLLRDVGWFRDGDNDGVEDNVDRCPSSDLTVGTILIDNCDTTVDNALFSTGCTTADYIDNLFSGPSGIWKISFFADWLEDQGLITKQQEKTLLTCATKSKWRHWSFRQHLGPLPRHHGGF